MILQLFKRVHLDEGQIMGKEIRQNLTTTAGDPDTFGTVPSMVL